MVNLEVVCLSALYLYLLFATLDGTGVSLQQWYHLPAEIRVLVMLSVLCILLVMLFRTVDQPASRCQVKTKRASMEDDWSVHSWKVGDSSFY